MLGLPGENVRYFTKDTPPADGGVTWTDAGFAATIEHNTGSGSIIDGGGNIGL